MKFDELFEQRSLVASKLKECIRDKGYTKVSFASKADISRPTLDKLLNGAIDSKSTFDRHLQKILKLLNMSVEELMFYHSVSAKPVTVTVFSQNAPLEYEMSETAKQQYNLLLDVIELCAIYY
ncbi:MAG: helix-turn-helix transcriptional regulator [Lachnospiraceae bacterium]|nr:helix-turn-helix transcriptional regulator [Lachnospiraceae bacterium]